MMKELLSAGADNFLIVCLGGSAGGLEAYLSILRNLPPDTGMAFVIAPHRSIEQAHLLRAILKRATTMPVIEIEHGTLLKANCVFIMPPGKDMNINASGEFGLEDTVTIRRGWPITISGFLLSLANTYGSRTVAVILSGMDHDGSIALKAIKAAGGMTFAQSNPEFDSMPRHAVETGHVDFILSPPEIAKALLGLRNSKSL